MYYCGFGVGVGAWGNNPMRGHGPRNIGALARLARFPPHIGALARLARLRNRFNTTAVSVPGTNQINRIYKAQP